MANKAKTRAAVDAQAAVIVYADQLVGSLLADADLIATVMARVSPDAFPEGTPAAVLYEGIVTLSNAGIYSAGDLLVWLQRNEARLGQAYRGQYGDWPYGYLDYLQASVWPEKPEKLLTYADQINKYADLRALRSLCRTLHADTTSEGADPEVLVAKALQGIAAIRQARSSSSALVDASALAQTIRDRIPQWQRGEADGLSFGFKALESVRMGEGDLIVVAARPSMGKSAFVFQVAAHVAQGLRAAGENGVVAIFSLEMPGIALGMRVAGALSGVNAHRIQSGQADAAEYARFQRGLDELAKLPLYVDDSPLLTTDQLMYRVAWLNATRGPVRLVVFDFVELAGNASEGSEDLRVSAIAQGLKNVARGLRVPVLAASQVNRRCEERADKLPTLGDLRYGGNLEAVADKVIFLVRPELYLARGESIRLQRPSDSKGVAYVIVAKHRNGPVGFMRLAFLSDMTKFADLAE